jgi:hypothetical protein
VNDKFNVITELLSTGATKVQLVMICIKHCQLLKDINYCTIIRVITGTHRSLNMTGIDFLCPNQQTLCFGQLLNSGYSAQHLLNMTRVTSTVFALLNFLGVRELNQRDQTEHADVQHHYSVRWLTLGKNAKSPTECGIYRKK